MLVEKSNKRKSWIILGRKPRFIFEINQSGLKIANQGGRQQWNRTGQYRGFD
jgi:hypothetical protein